MQRAAVLIALTALACGEARGAADGPRGSLEPCITSYGCAEGERCDAGRCVLDES